MYVFAVDDEWNIDWKTVHENQELRYHKIQGNYFDCELALVTPGLYRGHDKKYIVTKVCEDISVQSAFPTDEYGTYADYYLRRHELTIKNMEQPMFEVRNVTEKINFIKPR